MRTLILPLLYLALASAQRSDDGYFASPGADVHEEDYLNNPQWELGSDRTIQWNWTESAWANYSIFLIQSGPEPTTDIPLYRKILDEPEEGSYLWTVDPDPYNLTESNVFYFGMVNEGNSSSGYIYSHYFNITEPESKSSTSSSAPATASSTAPAASRLGSLPTAAPVANTQQATNDSNRLPIALGVGLGLGIPIALLLGVLVGLKVMRNSSGGAPPQYMGVQNSPDMRDLPEYVAPVQKWSPSVTSREQG